MMTRRVLKELQASASDENALVGSPKMIPTKRKIRKDSKELFKHPKSVEKENEVAVKRINHKNVGGENETKKSGKISKKRTGLKVAKSRPVKDQSACRAVAEIILNQSRIDSCQSTSSSNPSITSEESIRSDFCNVTVRKSFSEGFSMLTSDSPRQSYYQDLAEQRRISLEVTLRENEQLTDQINVLSAENSLLKTALEAAQKLCQMEGLLD